MGNTLIKENEGRIKETVLGNEIRKIMMEYRDNQALGAKPMSNGTYPKIHLAKACAMEAVDTDIINASRLANRFVSVAFPVAITDLKNEDRKKKLKDKGILLDTQYVGFQFNGDKTTLCTDASLGTKGFEITGGRDSTTGNIRFSGKEIFMIDNCAKQMHEKGCFLYKKISDNRWSPVWNTDNELCFNQDDDLLAFGGPECACLNSNNGFNSNTYPSRGLANDNFNGKNPYGITENTQLSSQASTIYSLNLFNYEDGQQLPKLFDTRCLAASQKGPSNGHSTSFMLVRDTPKDTTICLNQINIANSDIGRSTLANIKQNNECGGPQKGNTPAPIIQGDDEIVGAEPVNSILYLTNDLSTIGSKGDKIELSGKKCKNGIKYSNLTNSKASINLNATDKAIEWKNKYFGNCTTDGLGTELKSNLSTTQPPMPVSKEFYAKSGISDLNIQVGDKLTISGLTCATGVKYDKIIVARTNSTITTDNRDQAWRDNYIGNCSETGLGTILSARISTQPITPSNISLPEIQGKWTTIGCTKTLTDNDISAWRSLNSLGELDDKIKAIYQATKDCNGKQEEMDLCIPGKCKPITTTTTPPTPITTTPTIPTTTPMIPPTTDDKVSEIPTTPTILPQVGPAPVTQDDSLLSPPTQPITEAPKSNILLYGTLGGVGLLIIIGLIVFFLFRRGSSVEDDE